METGTMNSAAGARLKKLKMTRRTRIAASREVCMVITFSKSKNQLGKVTNLARGQLNRENGYFPVPVRA